MHLERSHVFHPISQNSPTLTKVIIESLGDFNNGTSHVMKTVTARGISTMELVMS